MWPSTKHNAGYVHHHSKFCCAHGRLDMPFLELLGDFFLVAHFLKLHCGISVICLFSHLLTDIWIVFSMGPLWIKLLQTLKFRSFSRCVLFLLGKHLGLELLGFEKNVFNFSQVCAVFTFSPAMCDFHLVHFIANIWWCNFQQLWLVFPGTELWLCVSWWLTMLNSFSCAFWLLVYLLWSVYSNPFAIYYWTALPS